MSPLFIIFPMALIVYMFNQCVLIIINECIDECELDDLYKFNCTEHCNRYKKWKLTDAIILKTILEKNKDGVCDEICKYDLKKYFPVLLHTFKSEDWSSNECEYISKCVKKNV